MGKNRCKSGLIHKKGKEVFEISKEKNTGKYFIKGTNTEVPANKLCKKTGNEKTTKYDFQKPSQAQDFGDEWEEYAWSADDY